MEQDTTAWGPRGLGYDVAYDAVADLAGDFDAQSPVETERWVSTQWRTVADEFGWRAQLEAAGDGDAAALSAFETWLATWQRRNARRRPLPESQRSEQARVRHQSLEMLRRVATETKNLWWPDTLSDRLPESGCFAGEMRAFRSDVASSYFGDRHTVRPQGCVYPVRLSLGTFPYVYGGVLGPEAPGLRWRVIGPWKPASIAVEVMASFWREAGNSGQDARVVARQFEHFRSTIVRVVELEPTRKKRRANPIETAETALGPRGLVSERAIRHIQARFAAFFAARRAYTRARLRRDDATTIVAPAYGVPATRATPATRPPPRGWLEELIAT